MKKDLGIIFGLFGLVIGLLIFGKAFTTVGLFGTNQSATQSAGVASGQTVVKVKSLEITAQVAAKASDRKKGLGNRESLALNEGMLFVFEQESPYAIWMKDMKFAIDIIWIDDEKRIIDIVSNAPAEPDKNDKELTKYLPKESALYILEVNAGLVNLHNLQIGDSVDFQL